MNFKIKTLLKKIALGSILIGTFATTGTEINSPNVSASQIPVVSGTKQNPNNKMGKHDPKLLKRATQQAERRMKSESKKVIEKRQQEWNRKHTLKRSKKMKTIDVSTNKVKYVDTSKMDYDPRTRTFTDLDQRESLNRSVPIFNVDVSGFSSGEEPDELLLRDYYSNLKTRNETNSYTKREIPNKTLRINLNKASKGKDAFFDVNKLPKKFKFLKEKKDHLYSLIFDTQGNLIYKKDVTHTDITKVKDDNQKFIKNYLRDILGKRDKNSLTRSSGNWDIQQGPGSEIIAGSGIFNNIVTGQFEGGEVHNAFCLNPHAAPASTYNDNQAMGGDYATARTNEWATLATYGFQGCRSVLSSNTDGYLLTHFIGSKMLLLNNNPNGDPNLDRYLPQLSTQLGASSSSFISDTALRWHNYQMTDTMPENITSSFQYQNINSSSAQITGNNVQSVYNTYHGVKTRLYIPSDEHMSTYINGVYRTGSPEIKDGDVIRVDCTALLTGSLTYTFRTDASSINWNSAYISITNPQTQSMMIQGNVHTQAAGGAWFAVDFTNAVHYSFQVQKYAEQYDLSGAILKRVFNKAGTGFVFNGQKESRTTDSSGLTSPYWLEPGESTTFKETSAPNPYITDSHTYTVTAPNNYLGEVTVKDESGKTVATTHVPISGASYNYRFDVKNRRKPAEVPKPEKKIRTSNGLLSNVESYYDLPVAYELKGTVPITETDENFNVPHLTGFYLEDKLEPIFIIDSFVVYDSNLNKDITSDGQISPNITSGITKGTTVRWTLNNSVADNYQGHELIAKIKVHIDPMADLSPYLKDGNFSILNMASFNGDNIKNPPTTQTKPTKNSIDKKILVGDNELDHNNVNVGDKVDYIIHTHVKNDVGITDLSIYDKFEDVLNFDTTAPFQVIDKGTKDTPLNKDISADGVITKDKATNTVTWKANDPSRYRDHYIDVVGHVTLTGEMFEKYYDATTDTIKIPNDAHLVVNSDDLTSNTVTITPPVVKDQVDKKIVTSHGEDTWDKTDVNEDIKYIVKATVNNIHSLSSVQLYDKLENVFTYNNGSSQIIDTTKGQSKDVTTEGNISVDNNNVLTWTANDPTKFSGHTLEWTFTVKLTGNMFEKYYDATTDKIMIPNNAHLKINNNDESTKNVNVTPPTVHNSITKKIINDSGNEVDSDHTKVGQTIKFISHISVTNIKALGQLVLSDKFEPVYTYQNMKLIDTYHGAKDDITSQGKINLDNANNTLTWTANDPKKWAGHTFEWEKTVKLTGIMFQDYYDSTDDLIKIPNISELITDSETLKSNKVIETPPTIHNSITKKIINDKNQEVNTDNTEVGKTINFISRISVTNVKSLSKLILRDNLESVFTYQDMKLYDVTDGKHDDITNSGSITPSSSKHEILWTANDPTKWSGHSLEWHITVKLTGEMFEKYYDKNTDKILIPNTVDLITNSDVLPSNKVIETPPTVHDKVVKKIINNKDQEVEEDKTDYGENINFIGHFVINNIKDPTSVILRDNLEPVYTYKSMKVIDTTRNMNKDITLDGKINVDSSNVLRWEAANPKALSGHTLEWHVTVMLNKHADCSNYVTGTDKTIKIPNIMHLDFNGNPIDSQKVVETPPAINNKIIKHVYSDKENKDVDHLNINYDVNYNYNVYLTVSNIIKIKSLKILDNFDPMLDFHSMKVYDISFGQKDITNEGSILLDKKTNLLSWVMKSNQQSLAGHDLKVVITASIRSHTDLSNYIKNNEIEIPNTAHMVINDDDEKSNTPVVTPPPVAPKIIKKVYDSVSKQEVNSLNIKHDEPYDYIVRVIIGNSRKLGRVVVYDKLEPPLAFDNAKIEDVTYGDSNAKDITDQGELKVQGQKIYWIAKEPQLLSGKELKLTLTVHLRYNQDLGNYLNDKDEIKIPNTATLWTNEHPEGTPPVYVTPPTKNDSIIKYVSNDSNNKYTLKDFKEIIPMWFNIYVGNKKELKDLQIYDQLEPVFDVTGDIKIINLSANNKDITNQGKLFIQNHYFKWISNNPSELSESHLKVTFNVKMLKSQKLNNYWSSNHSRIEVPNVGHLVTNGSDLSSKPVKVTPPTDKPSIHKWIVNSGDLKLNDGTTENSTIKPDDSVSKESFSKVPMSEISSQSGFDSDSVISSSGEKPLPPEIPIIGLFGQTEKTITHLLNKVGSFFNGNSH